jgi:hypothetical protein
LLFGQPGERCAALGVCDRGCDELGELLDAFFGVLRQRLLAMDRHGTPETPLDDDRAGNRRDDAHTTVGVANRPVDRDQMRSAAGRASGAVHVEGSHPLLELPVHADREGCADLARRADVTDPLAVVVVPDDRRRVRTDEPPDLVADRGEELVGPDAVRHEHGNTPERRLLVGEVLESLARLGSDWLARPTHAPYCDLSVCLAKE